MSGSFRGNKIHEMIDSGEVCVKSGGVRNATDYILSAARAVARAPHAHLALVDEVHAEFQRQSGVSLSIVAFKALVLALFEDGALGLAKANMPQTWDPSRLAACSIRRGPDRFAYIEVR